MSPVNICLASLSSPVTASLSSFTNVPLLLFVSFRKNSPSLCHIIAWLRDSTCSKKTFALFLFLCLFLADLLVSADNFSPTKIITLAAVKPLVNDENIMKLSWAAIKQGMAVRLIRLNNSYFESCRNIELLENTKRKMDFILVYAQMLKNASTTEDDPGCPELNDAENFASVFDYLNGTVHYVFDETDKVTTQSYDSLVRQVIGDRKDKWDSVIPGDYPSKAEEDKANQRKLFMAIIAMLSMIIFGLIAVIFCTALSRYRARKKGVAAMQRAKPTQEVGIKSSDGTTKKSKSQKRPKPSLEEPSAPAVDSTKKSKRSKVDESELKQTQEESKSQSSKNKESKEKESNEKIPSRDDKTQADTTASPHKKKMISTKINQTTLLKDPNVTNMGGETQEEKDALRRWQEQNKQLIEELQKQQPKQEAPKKNNTSGQATQPAQGAQAK
ncbi:hypothetical protein WR25_27282 [Diploscapter pachys]|uniref:Uncharacterized protein n=1 Tax=Diploscapter pachys TaxID=2018661 RepID=A0A2A2JHV9_9BILA|nr:hypothetical protein WR25_27282 [Diploscapter pachys]